MENLDYKLNDVIGDDVYSGVQGYHSHGQVGNYMKQGGSIKYPYWVGIELEVECNRSSTRDWLSEKKSNWFYLETDGSLDNYGVEIITVRMNPKVAYNPEIWSDLVEALVDRGATSHDNGRCGLHVHVSRSAFGINEEERDETITKLLHIYHNEIEQKTNYLNLVFRRGFDTYCRKTINNIPIEKKHLLEFMSVAGSKAVNTAYRKATQKDISKYGDRYESVNRSCGQTIEFRQGRGTLKAASIATTIEFVCELVEFCRKNTFDNCNVSNFTAHVKGLKKTSELRKVLITRNER